MEPFVPPGLHHYSSLLAAFSHCIFLYGAVTIIILLFVCLFLFFFFFVLFLLSLETVQSPSVEAEFFSPVCRYF